VNDSHRSYLHSPLESVDAASLTRLAEELRSSPAKPKKAVSSFLLRYVEYIGGKAGNGGEMPEESQTSGLGDLRSLR
jgi:hypothetical protein